MHNQIDISEAGASLVTGIRQVPVEDNDLLLMVVENNRNLCVTGFNEIKLIERPREIRGILRPLTRVYNGELN